ncbi:MAG TPA: hypothetical protein VFV23_11500 [Verrucomicrobiae bacterium]|nr:hypothetical protein [Verrucomicrobiae bacterium]
MNLSLCSKKSVADETQIFVPQALAARPVRMFFPACRTRFLTLRTANLRAGSFFLQRRTRILRGRTTILRARISVRFERIYFLHGRTAILLGRNSVLYGRNNFLHGRKNILFREIPYFSAIYPFFRNHRKNRKEVNGYG